MVQTDGVTYLDIPVKSENDKKYYKTLVLANGVRALLVSDPTPKPHDGLTSSSNGGNSSAESSAGESMATSSTSDCDSLIGSYESSDEGDEKLAACAVCVDVGAFSEPPQYEGLAHFLEHMIFMGSGKYPAENAFDVHIKKCGGFDNANTETEETFFYFEVSEEHLDTSIDYFAALLKDPLMKKEAMQRERESVESEFQQTKHDDEARRDQLLASLATPGFPHKVFTWGNLQSLQVGVNDDELHQVLHDFRKKHYSAHRMVVVLQARLPIDMLEDLVVKHFADLPSNDLPGLDFTNFDYRKAFCDDFFDKVYVVKPVENTCKLELTWVLPPMKNAYKCKPDQFMAYLLGYEGEGSLCAYLRRKLWGLELVCGVDSSGFDTNSMYSLFNLCIYLTDNGFKNIDDVLEATFAFIKQIASSADLQTSYAELQNIEATSFRFQPQKPAFDNVQELAYKTKVYPPKDILTGDVLYFEYNESEVKEVLDILNSFHFNIMITSEEKYNGIECDLKEKWFGTQYAVIDIPAKWRDLWENTKYMPELFCPKPNQFISTDFRIFWQEAGQPELSPWPKKLMQTDVCELWFRQDDKFNLPETLMYFYFISPLLRQSPQNDVQCALFSHLIKFRLGEELYPATVANLSYSLSCSERGLLLKVDGYNEKLHLLVDIITKAMVSMRDTITKEQLDCFKKHQKRSYFNSLIKGHHLNKDVRLSILENIHFPMIDKYKCINDITLDDILDFADKFANELYVQALIQGNYTEESAHNVMNTVLSTLNCKKIKEPRYIENRTVQLPQGSRYIRCKALNSTDCNTVITNFYQIGPASVRIESLLDLLIMFTEEPLFDTLRTKEQLGYYVGSMVRMTYGIIGYSITVNSQETKHNAAYVEERIENFRLKMMEILEAMTQEDYDHVRESLIKLKQVVDMSLEEEFLRNWSEITSEEYMFDRRKREIEVLKFLLKQEIIDFCVNNEQTNLRKLSVQVLGNLPSSAIKNSETQEDACEKSKSSDSDSEEDDDKANEELFNALENKLNLEFLPKDGDATTIVDIQDFKESLFVFPITKTKLDDNSPNEQPRSNATTPFEIIEDC